MEGVWCRIVIGGGIGTGGGENNQFPGGGLCGLVVLVRRWWEERVFMVAGENMNGLEVGA